MCPRSGSALAARIRGDAFDGPGPIKVFLGKFMGIFKDSGGGNKSCASIVAKCFGRIGRDLENFSLPPVSRLLKARCNKQFIWTVKVKAVLSR